MGVGKDKKQVPVILPLNILKLVDDEADYEDRSRSSQITRILKEYYIRNGKLEDMANKNLSVEED
jgi:hypothetical protein